MKKLSSTFFCKTIRDFFFFSHISSYEERKNRIYTYLLIALWYVCFQFVCFNVCFSFCSKSVCSVVCISFCFYSAQHIQFNICEELTIVNEKVNEKIKKWVFKYDRESKFRSLRKSWLNVWRKNQSNWILRFICIKKSVYICE